MSAIKSFNVEEINRLFLFLRSNASSHRAKIDVMISKHLHDVRGLRSDQVQFLLGRLEERRTVCLGRETSDSGVPVTHSSHKPWACEQQEGGSVPTLTVHLALRMFAS